MKNIKISVLIALMLLLFSLVAVAGEMGDANGDGVVDLKDITYLRRALAGGYGISIQGSAHVSAADVNGDGEISLRDITTLRRYLAGGYGAELVQGYTYTVTGTETIGTNKTGSSNEIHITCSENSKKMTVNVNDIGIPEYAGKTNALYGLYLYMIESENGIRCAEVKGKITDGLTVTYTNYSFSINGVTYTADTMKDGFLCDAYRNPVDVEIFDAEGKVTTDFRDMVLVEHNARLIDFEGDGIADRMTVVPKVAYEVSGISKTLQGENYRLQTLDEYSIMRVPCEAVDIELQKGDIVLLSNFGGFVYAERITPVNTYATKLNTAESLLTLNKVGTVAFNHGKIYDLPTVNVSTNLLGAANIYTYYIYNNNIVCIFAIAAEPNIAVLRDVVYDDGYSANVITLDGDMISLPLSDEDGEELYAYYKLDSDYDYDRYNYAMICDYDQRDDGTYELYIDEEIYDEDWVMIPAGSTYSYNSELGLSSIGYYNKIICNENTRILTTDDEDGYYEWFTADDLTADFIATTRTSSLLRRSDNGRLYLVCTVTDEIEFVREDVSNYTNDGSLIQFAYEDSAVTLLDGALYNEYYFMDINTLKFKESEIDTKREYDNITNRGAYAGDLYGYNPVNETYDKITNSLDLETVKAGSLTDIIFDLNIIELTDRDGNSSLFKVGENVNIWGLSDSDSLYEIKTFDFSELDEMYELVLLYNEEQWESEMMEVIDTILLFRYDDDSDKMVLCSVIVEVYERDPDDDAYVRSVNDIIFDNYYYE